MGSFSCFFFTIYWFVSNIEIVVNNQWGDSTNFPTFLKYINKFYDYYRRDKRTNEVTVYRKNNS